MTALERDQVAAGDIVHLTYAPNWDGQAVVSFASPDAVRLHMMTGTYTGAEGSFAWRDRSEWSINPVEKQA